MQLTLIGHDRRFAVEQALLNYFPNRDGGSAVSRLSDSGKLATAVIEYQGRTAYGRAWAGAARIDRPLQVGAADEHCTPSSLNSPPLDNALRLAFYRAAKQLVTPPPWGALTGVRPVKKASILLAQMSGSGKSNGQANPISKERLSRELQRRYDVSPVRSHMAADCAVQTASLRKKLSRRDIALYIGIPFCPTRCAYCSFVSSSVERDGRLLEPYLKVLCEEISLAGQTVSRMGLTVRTVYWGGGTPAVLPPEQFSLIWRALEAGFDLGGLWEHTVEMGRPDVVTAEKLTVLQEFGVNRVSVNPQTLRQEVLDAIGRRHTPEQFFAAFDMARARLFDSINVDLIAGLPGDDPQGFLAGLDRVISLKPENITIHTLAKKRGSDLSRSAGADRVRPQAAENLPCNADRTGYMLSGAIERLRDNAYAPYYLYRQKFTEGGFENTGWSKPGHECLYNLCMMEELSTVVSLGAGGVTKVVRGDRIERMFHCKYPLEYIERRDTMNESYAKLEALYE